MHLKRNKQSQQKQKKRKKSLSKYHLNKKNRKRLSKPQNNKLLNNLNHPTMPKRRKFLRIKAHKSPNYQLTNKKF